MKKTLNLFLCLLVLSLVACDEDELTNPKQQKGKLVKTIRFSQAAIRDGQIYTSSGHEYPFSKYFCEYSFEYNADNKVSSFTEAQIDYDYDEKNIVDKGEDKGFPADVVKIDIERPNEPSVFKVEYVDNQVYIILEDGRKESYTVNNMGNIVFDNDSYLDIEYNESGRLAKLKSMHDGSGFTVDFNYSRDGNLLASLARTFTGSKSEDYEKTKYKPSKYDNINGLFIPTHDNFDYNEFRMLGQMGLLGLASPKLPREVVRENEYEKVRYKYEYTFDNEGNVTSCKVKMKRTNLELKTSIRESITLEYGY